MENDTVKNYINTCRLFFRKMTDNWKKKKEAFIDVDRHIHCDAIEHIWSSISRHSQKMTVYSPFECKCLDNLQWYTLFQFIVLLGVIWYCSRKWREIKSDQIKLLTVLWILVQLVKWHKYKSYIDTQLKRIFFILFRYCWCGLHSSYSYKNESHRKTRHACVCYSFICFIHQMKKKKISFRFSIQCKKKMPCHFVLPSTSSHDKTLFRLLIHQNM